MFYENLNIAFYDEILSRLRDLNSIKTYPDKTSISVRL